MNPITLAALQDSIRHWHRDNVLAEQQENYKISRYDCSLCSIFFGNGCVDCPVADATGDTNCVISPYEIAEDRAYNWELNPEGEEEKAAFIAAAIKERDFLISLLPTSELQEKIKKELGI